MDLTSSNDSAPMGGGHRGGMDAQTEEVTAAETEEDTVSQKGIKGESTYIINGGHVTTNDGSEDNPGQMGGGQPGGGKGAERPDDLLPEEMAAEET